MDENDLDILTATAQRLKLLNNGVAGPLTDRQRTLSKDIESSVLELLQKAKDQVGEISNELSTFDLGRLVLDIAQRYSFLANARQISISVTGAHSGVCVRAVKPVSERVIANSLDNAVRMAPSGGRVLVELCRSAERMAIDISAAGWSPVMPPSPSDGSGAALSCLRTASGARLVISFPVAEE